MIPKDQENIIIRGDNGQQLDEQLTPFIDRLMDVYDLPGFAVGAVVDGKTVYARGFGVRKAGMKEPVTMKTMFHLASVSKPFSATAILQLASRGLLELDDPVQAHLPSFNLDDKRCREITIAQMLSHVSGMPDVEDYEWDQPEYDDEAMERYVHSLSARRLLSDPGEKYAYSNMAFECLGALIARVSGMTFEEYIFKHILQPVGMAESSFLMENGYRQGLPLPINWAVPHLRTLGNTAWEGYPYNRQHAPSSTLHSNAAEMCNWAITNLKRGRFEGQEVLPDEAYDLLWSPRAKNEYDEAVGLSWFITNYRGEQLIFHGGGDTGFRSNLYLLPEKGMAVVVLCNRLPAPAEIAADAAVDILLGHEPNPIRPHASLTVCETLVQKGSVAAVAQWMDLRSNHVKEYETDNQLASYLQGAVVLDRLDEARKIAELCIHLLPEEDMKETADFTRAWLEKRPGNRAARAVLDVFAKQKPG